MQISKEHLKELMKQQDREVSDSVERMRKEYPSVADEFERLQYQQLCLFSKKMLDYGIENISVGTKLENDQEIKLSLTGLYFRMNDKISRLKQLVALNKEAHVTTESVQDTFQDLSIYGIIAQIVANKKWK